MPDSPSYPNLPLANIDRFDRYRQSYRNIDKLAESISILGLAQPIVLNIQSDGSYKLVAGGRRCKALELLNISTLEHGITCEPGRAGYVVRQELSAETLLELELEENLQREDTEWYEDVLQFRNIAKSYERKAALSSQTWGYRQAGMLLGVSSARAHGIITVAEYLIKSDKEIQEAGSLDNAIRILLGRKEDEANKILAKESASSFTFHENLPGAKAPLDEIVIDLGELPGSKASRKSGSETEQEDTKEPEIFAPGFEEKEITIPLSRMFFQGDFREIMPKMPSESVDHILTDIPYGIEMDNLDVQNQERVEAQHDVEENVSLMPDFVKQAFRVVKDKGYVVFFYDLDWHIYLRELAVKEGFKVQRWPFVWVKTHPCRNQAPQYNFTKTIETAMVLRKGNATLNMPQTRGHILEDGQIERKLYRNPFAKPFAVWKVLLDAIALKGQIILDPFAGEMSCPRAVINSGMQPMGIELMEHHFNAGIEGVKTVYNVLTRNQAKFV